MTDRKAMKILESDWSEAGYGDELISDALELSISALRDRIECQNPQPLTIEQLREMAGEPVYVQHASGSGFWRICFGVDDGQKNGKIKVCFQGVPSSMTWDYGKTWLAYRAKPEPPEGVTP